MNANEVHGTDPDQPPELSFDPASIPSWRSSTPLGAAIDAQHAGILREAVATMPIASAALVNLRHGLGPLPPLSTIQISAMLGVDRHEIEQRLRQAHLALRTALLARGLDGIDGGDEAICQSGPPSGRSVQPRRISCKTAARLLDEGLVRGTHSPADTPERAARRAAAADASERIDPAWIERDQRRRAARRQEALILQASRRAAMASATAIVTRAALATPTLSVGIRPDAAQTRFAVYAFDGAGGDGHALLGGAFHSPEQLSRVEARIVRELTLYRDRAIRPASRRTA